MVKVYDKSLNNVMVENKTRHQVASVQHIMLS
jgi:hypothetical protein